MKIHILLIFFVTAMAFNSCSSREIDGGWVKLNPESEDVIKAVSFLKKILVKKHPDIKIGKILSAESQIVAGQNLRIVCLYTSDTNKEPKTLKASIFVSLEDKYTLEKLDLE